MKLWVPGTPRPKERPRLGRAGVRTPSRTRAHEEAIAWAWRQAYPHHLPWACDVWVCCTFVGGTGDIDNLAKLCLDAMNGIVYLDDRQVKRLTVRRLEAGDVPAGTVIEVRPMTGPWRAQLARRVRALVEPAANCGSATSPGRR